MNTNKTINLEVNGRIFPNWVLKNFKKFTLPEIIRKEGEDPCQEKLKNELTPYQRFLGSFLNYRSPFKDMLIFHGLGSGKTVSAIHIYNSLFNYTPKWNVFMLIPASLRNDPWIKDLNRWLEKDNKDLRVKNIIFIHYDSPFADKDFLEKVKRADSSRNSLFIIDEAHNFIRNVYNNISTKTGKRAQVIYDYIQQEKKENSKTRIIMLTATPTVNTPYELALYYNLMRPGTFPNSEAVFNQIYISSTNFQSLNDETKNMFQRRILGLTSYYLGATPDKFAQKKIHYKSIYMREYHQKVYEHFEEIEEKKELMLQRMNKGKIGENYSTYASYTRQACNFVFPKMGDLTGEDRPRPGKFRIKDDDAVNVDEGKDKEKIRELAKKKKEVVAYQEAIKKYVNTFINHLKEIHRKDKKDNYTLQDDVKLFFEKYEGSLTKMLKLQEKNSNLFKELYKCSPKFMHAIFNILKSPGPTLVYSNYVEMEGLQIFKIYLMFFGFISFNSDTELNMNKLDKNYSKDNFRYTEFHGSVDKELRTKNKSVFNQKENKHGKIIKIIMISPAGAEGISLSNCRQVHIIEPFWNEVRIEQVIGRAIRQCQHRDLPMNERNVDVFRYKMIRKNEKETSDEKMESIARKKNNLLISFLEAVKQVAVDCELFKAHNMMGTKYECFKFNENSLLENPPGPAFHKTEDFDFKMNNGLNSKDSLSQRIKVMKISAVKRIDENTTSEINNYWYYKPTGMVYDYDLNFPVGKIEYDLNGDPVVIDSNVYVIGTVINVPDFKLFD
jgi:superfamily II DNA or RNA helicase